MYRVFQPKRLLVTLASSCLMLCLQQTSGATLFRIPLRLDKPGLSLSGPGLQTSDASSEGTLSFENQQVDTTSTAQGVQLSNSGNTPVGINSVSVSGPFEASTNCATSLAVGALAVGANCTTNVTFTPTAMGSQSGTLTFATNAGNQVVALAGTGTQAILGASPTFLSFTGLAGSTASQSFTLSNRGNLAATSLTFSPSAAYSQTNTCGGSLAAGANCSVTVSFALSSAESYAGALAITSTTGTLSVPVTGVASGYSLMPNPIAFGTINGTNASIPVVLSNTGPTALSVGTLSLGSFLFTVAADGCSGKTIPSGGTCTFIVNYSAVSLGNASATLGIPVDGVTKTYQVTGAFFD
jgi:Abnormal spindle-like microcephaly-assoc'd, ASPM-SPD-2-Hydin